MRKIIGSLILLSFIAFWIWAAGTVGTHTANWPFWAQMAFFVIAGFGWIFPLKPLFGWINRGQPPEED